MSRVLAAIIALSTLCAVACEADEGQDHSFATPEPVPTEPVSQCEQEADDALELCLAEEGWCQGQWDAHCLGDRADTLIGCGVRAEQSECLVECYADRAYAMAYACQQFGPEGQELDDTCINWCG